MSQPPADLSYEKALELLDAKLRSLEDGNLTLDQALAAVDEARVYLKVCQEKLAAAKQKIDVRPEAPAGEPDDTGDRLL